jgi:hypothetical protein
MTVQASSCFDDNEEHAQKEVSCCDHPPRKTLSRERERERERKNKKEKQRDTFREREPSSLVGLIVVLSFDFERAREDVSLSLSLLAHTVKRRVSSDLAIHTTTTRGRNHQR